MHLTKYSRSRHPGERSFDINTVILGLSARHCLLHLARMFDTANNLALHIPTRRHRALLRNSSYHTHVQDFLRVPLLGILIE